MLFRCPETRPPEDDEHDADSDLPDDPAVPEQDTADPEIPAENLVQPNVPAIEALIRFDDVPEQHWAFSYITDLAGRKILTGPGDGLFYPDNYVTRAEFVTMLAKLHGAPSSAAAVSGFADISPTDWYAPYVYWATSAGIVTGVSANEFAPHMLLTREQMATIIMRYLDRTGATLPHRHDPTVFTDVGAIADYAKAAVTAAQTAGLLSGYPDGSFAPQNRLTRCEAAKVLSSLISLTENKLIVH